MRFLFLGTTIILMAIGQVLFKLSAVRASGDGLGFLISPTFLVALTVYAAATFAWIMTLRAWPISVAYPATAFAIVLVVGMGVVFFGETLSSMQVLGMSAILGGLFLLALG